MAKMKGASLENSIPKDENDFQSEDDMRVMHQASAIAADQPRLKKVHKLAGRKHKALQGMIEPMLKGPRPPKKPKNLSELKAMANKDQSTKDDDEGME